MLIIRLLAGGVFFWEGMLKFVYANQGVGRFTKLGFPSCHSHPHPQKLASGQFCMRSVRTMHKS